MKLRLFVWIHLKDWTVGYVCVYLIDKNYMRDTKWIVVEWISGMKLEIKGENKWDINLHSKNKTNITLEDNRNLNKGRTHHNDDFIMESWFWICKMVEQWIMFVCDWCELKWIWIYRYANQH